MSRTIAVAGVPDIRERVGLGRYLALVGRICYSAIFIFAGPNHFRAGIIGFAAAQGVPLASIAVPLSGTVALLGGA
jgi:putative oxidoreductase